MPVKETLARAQEADEMAMIFNFESHKRSKMLQQQTWAREQEDAWKHLQSEKEKEKKMLQEKMESDASWELLDKEGWLKHKEELEDEAWKQTLLQAAEGEEHKRSLWKAKRTFDKVMQEEEEEAARNAEEPCASLTKKGHAHQRRKISRNQQQQCH